VWSLIEDADSELPEALRPIFAEACLEIREIEARVKQVERQLEATAQQLLPSNTCVPSRESGC
jgi:hypothetical protein